MVHRIRFVYPCLLLVAAASCGCHNAPPAAPVQAQAGPAPVSPPPTKEATPPTPTPPSPAPIKEAIDTLLAQSPPFPKGAHVLSVDVKDGVVTLDLSKEFSALANSGDTTESNAMKALQAALAKFPDVQKMRVTVEGKSFDSQVTDWNTPFAVRNTPGGAEGGGQ